MYCCIKPKQKSFKKPGTMNNYLITTIVPMVKRDAYMIQSSRKETQFPVKIRMNLWKLVILILLKIGHISNLPRLIKYQLQLPSEVCTDVALLDHHGCLRSSQVYHAWSTLFFCSNNKYFKTRVTLNQLTFQARN